MHPRRPSSSAVAAILVGEQWQLFVISPSRNTATRSNSKLGFDGLPLTFGKDLACEDRAHEITNAPDQPTRSHCTEVVEWNTEFGRNDAQAVQANARPEVGDVADATAMNAIAAGKVDQDAAINQRAPGGAPLGSARLKYFLVCWHGSNPLRTKLPGE
jgi:hypothetical protein